MQGEGLKEGLVGTMNPAWLLSTANRLFDPPYLLETRPGPVGSKWPFYLGLGLFFLLLGTASIWSQVRRVRQRAGIRFMVGSALLGLAHVIARWMVWPGLSARLWLFLALGGLVIGWVISQARPGAGQQLLRSLSFQPSGDIFSSWLPLAALLLAHLIGLTAIVAGLGWPLWSSWLVLIVWVTPTVITGLWKRSRPARFWAQTALLSLAPLALLYAMWLVRALVILTTHAIDPTSPDFALPPGWLEWLNLPAAFLAAAAYGCLVQATALANSHRRLIFSLTSVSLTAIFLWVAAESWLHRARGVTGSDPYCYVQMAIDLAAGQGGVHRFPLFQVLRELDISWFPLVHVGYHLPFNQAGQAVTVWPPGWSVWLAVSRWLAGDAGLYLAAPAVNLLTLAAVAALTWELLEARSWGHGLRWLAVTVAVGLLATSHEQLIQASVPMADVPAQLFSVLAVLFAWRSSWQTERRARLQALLAGLCLGWAYLVRHTQIVIVLPALVAAWPPTGKNRRQRWLGRVGLCGAAALVTALPDLVYHQLYFGGFLHLETTEWPLFGWRHIGPSLVRMSQAALSGRGWLYLVPLPLYGFYVLSEGQQRAAFVLLAWFGAVMAVHLPYQALRWRDLLSVFPVLSLWTAAGIVELLRRLWRWKESRRAVIVSGLFLLLLLLALRSSSTLERPFRPYTNTFGYLNPHQRAAFSSLALLLPPEAIVGCGLNSGAIELYGQRMAVRPGEWSPVELEVFAHAVADLRRPFYLLDDGVDVRPAVDYAAQHWGLRPVVWLDVPYYGDPDRPSGAMLYAVSSAQEPFCKETQHLGLAQRFIVLR